MRLYLFTLEIDPLTVGSVYHPLPSHLTLVSRFWSILPPEEVANAVASIFEHTKPIELIFGEEDRIGPKNTAVHLIKKADTTKQLHGQLVEALDSVDVTYTLPQFMGKGYLPHVSKREGVTFTSGSYRGVYAAYLVEVEIHNNDHLRYVCAKFDLSG